MKIDNVFETPEGKLHFTGELTQKELEAVVMVGLNYMFRVGAINELGVQKEEDKTSNVIN